MLIMIFVRIQSILLNKHCGENKGIYFMWCGRISDIKNILDVWEIRPFIHRGDFSNKKSQQNTALGKCTQSCKPFLVWTGRKYRCEQFLWRFLWNASMNFTYSVLQQWMVGVQGTWAVGHAVYLSYTQTPVREQNSMGAAVQILVREYICTEKLPKEHGGNPLAAVGILLT